MKHIRSSFLFFLLYVLVHSAYPVAAQEPEGISGNTQEANQLTDEDKEIIRNLDLIENIDWLIDVDLPLLENLELFLTNS